MELHQHGNYNSVVPLYCVRQLPEKKYLMSLWKTSIINRTP